MHRVPKGTVSSCDLHRAILIGEKWACARRTEVFIGTCPYQIKEYEENPSALPYSILWLLVPSSDEKH